MIYLYITITIIQTIIWLVFFLMNWHVAKEYGVVEKEYFLTFRKNFRFWQNFIPLYFLFIIMKQAMSDADKWEDETLSPEELEIKKRKRKLSSILNK